MDWPEPQHLPLAAIDSSHRWSLHQDLEPGIDETLIASVRTFGIIRPPLVRRTGAERYELVCGSSRLRALAALGRQKALCLVVNPALQDGDLLILTARDQAETGVLTPIEAARWTLLAATCSAQDVFDILSPYCGIKNRGQLQRIVQLLELEPLLRQAIHEGRISAKTGLALSSLPTQDRLFLGQLFSTLTLNDNKQQRIIEFGRIITVREECSFTDLFRSRYRYCLDIVGQQPNLPQITNRLLDDLYRQSHPLISTARQHFADRVNNLQLPTHCTVTPSMSFEYDRVTLSIEFKDLDELQARWPVLKKHLG